MTVLAVAILLTRCQSGKQKKEEINGESSTGSVVQKIDTKCVKLYRLLIILLAAMVVFTGCSNGGGTVPSGTGMGNAQSQSGNSLKECDWMLKVSDIQKGSLNIGGKSVDGNITLEFRIHGEDLQFVEIMLDPGETIIAEAGAMMYMDSAIEMDTIFGDGSGKEGNDLMGKLFSAGKRMITGESLFVTSFTNTGSGKRKQH